MLSVVSGSSLALPSNPRAERVTISVVSVSFCGITCTVAGMAPSVVSRLRSDVSAFVMHRSIAPACPQSLCRQLAVLQPSSQ